MKRTTKLTSLLLAGLWFSFAAQLTAGETADLKIEYQVDLSDVRNHYVTIEAKIPVTAEQMQLMLPVWTPGSYLVREYARHIDSMEAKTRRGEPISFRKVRKNRWEFEAGDERYLYLKYRVYCNELSVRTNFVNNAYAVLNGAATFLTFAEGNNVDHVVKLHLPPNWKRSATSLEKYSSTPNMYRAKSYDELVDSPIVAGNIQSFPFEVGGVVHELVNVNDRGFWDGDRAARDLKKVVAEHHELWGTVPYDRYLFLNVIANGGGGLEHDNSCLMLTSRWTFRDPGRYKRWLSLASHEFFHTWNIRRLRPRSLINYDYENEVYTRSLWVGEGVTSYYEDLLLARAGFYSNTEYLGIASGGIQSLQNTIGRKKQSLSDSSYDAWIKFYRSDENSSNTRVSYYTKGAVAAMLLDAEIRVRTDNEKSLDDVMRLLYQRHLVDGYTPADVRKIASEVAGDDLSDWFKRAIDSTEELDYSVLEECFGLELPGLQERKERASISSWIKNFSRRMGGREATSGGNPWIGFSTSGSDRVVVTRVEADSPATEAGINTDDEIIAINGFRVSGSISRAIRRYKVGDEVEILITRGDEVQTRKLTIGNRETRSWRLSRSNNASKRQTSRYTEWLSETTEAVSSDDASEAAQGDGDQANPVGEVKVEMKTTIKLPETSYEPTLENCVVLTIKHLPNEEPGFAVYLGPNIKSEFRVNSESEGGLKSEIAKYVDQTLAIDDAKKGILISCDGDVTTGQVQLVKAGVGESQLAKDCALYDGILDEDEAKSVDKQ